MTVTVTVLVTMAVAETESHSDMTVSDGEVHPIADEAFPQDISSEAVGSKPIF